MHAASSAPSFVPYPALLFVALQFPLAWTLSWPNWTLASLALGWLLYRAHLVLKLPIDELVNILGLEVPSAPIVYLLAVSSDSVALHWKPTESRHATSKYLIRVNGIQVGGEQASNITAVTLNNLPPGQLYNIRVVAINSASFQASSEALYVRTLSSTTSSEGASIAAQDADTLRPASDAASVARVPSVTVLKGFTEALTPGQGPHSMIREPSSGTLQSKRRASDRRSSPVIHAQDGQRRRISGGDAAAMPKEDVKPLTERLDSLQREIKEVAQQDQAEEDEFETRKVGLMAERDSLRAQLKEKEEGSKDLKKSVTSLERANTAAQSKKAAQEKILQQKKMERQKMKDDKIRWAREVVEMQQESEDLVRLKQEHADKTSAQVEEIRQEQNPDLEKIKELEERIRDRGTQVKELEEIRRALDEQLDSEDAGDVKAAEDEAAYQQTMRALQAKYHQAWHELSQAQIHYQQTQGRLNMLQSRRGSQSNFMVPSTNDFPPEFVPSSVTAAAAAAAAAASAASAASTAGAANDASRMPEQQPYTSFSSGYNRYPHIPHSRSPAGFNPVPRTSSPFFNASNLAPSQPPRSLERIPQAEIENLTGGALASPGASMLLPSDLLGDDPYDSIDQRFTPPRRVDSDRSQHSRPSSTAPGSTQHGRSGDSTRTGFLPPLPGLGTVPGMAGGMDSAVSLQHIPSSPNSQHSESPHSLFASPHGSMSNFHAHRVSEGTADSDRRSLHSVGSSSGPTRTSGRFSSFFGRQRGKTTSDDGPDLGTLKPSKTQSMPRSTDWEETQNAFPLGQRKGAAGSLLGQVGNSLLGRRERLGNRNAAELNISGPLDGRPANSSNIWAFQPMGGSGSRPASVYSENVVPARSDMDSRPFGGWSSSTTDVVNRSNSTRTGHMMHNPWSSSRRASVQADNFDQLPPDGNDMMEDDDDGDDDDDYDGPQEAMSPPQAPIGTRPLRSTDASSAAAANGAHHLNPAARDFRSIFKKRPKVPSTTDEDSKDGSPRLSREQQRQASSADGSTEDVSSTRGGVGGGGDSSAPSTPAEMATTPQPGSANRDSLMRKIARKGSSTKFALGSISGRDKSASSSTAGSFFSRRSNNAALSVETDSANATTDDDAGSIAPGRSLESLPGTPLGPENASKESKRSSGFSLSSFGKSRRGRKANDAPSISETSMTSASAGGVTDDEATANERISVDELAER